MLQPWQLQYEYGTKLNKLAEKKHKDANESAQW